MKKIEQFIDENLVEFLKLDESEVEQYSVDEFDNDIVDYLKLNYRFDYNNICIYYVDDSNEIWVENMS
jgi:hypothetical protein